MNPQRVPSLGELYIGSTYRLFWRTRSLCATPHGALATDLPLQPLPQAFLQVGWGPKLDMSGFCPTVYSFIQVSVPGFLPAYGQMSRYPSAWD